MTRPDPWFFFSLRGREEPRTALQSIVVCACCFENPFIFLYASCIAGALAIGDDRYAMVIEIHDARWSQGMPQYICSEWLLRACSKVVYGGSALAHFVIIAVRDVRT